MRATILAVCLCVSLWANTAQERLSDASGVFTEIMSAPDKGIPRELLEQASCVVVIPGLKKAAFVVGGQFGKGFVVCRGTEGKGWRDPAAVRVEGGSVGFQIGGSETDVVMLVMSRAGMDKLMQSKFTVGADASVAAGPVGRTASADTDAYMHAEILSWSRARGLFAGLALNGATLRPDEDANRELYGEKLATRQVLDGHFAEPPAARPLIAELDKYSYKAGTTTKATRKERTKK